MAFIGGLVLLLLVIGIATATNKDMKKGLAVILGSCIVLGILATFGWPLVLLIIAAFVIKGMLKS